MSYNTKEIKRDVNNNPIPQQFNPATDEYEVLQVMEYYGKSTDTKPTANIAVGSTYFEIDTVEVFMWDGVNWVVI